MRTILHQPLQAYCRQLVDLVQKSITAPDPARFLYQQHARALLFSVESITRLVYKWDESGKCKKALKASKTLEDLLGAAEDYDNFHKQFEKNKLIKTIELAYFVAKRDRAFEKLNKKLIKNDFYQNVFNAVAALNIDFNDKQFINQLKKQLHNEIISSSDFFAQFPDKFTALESQVHELRRKLRWWSIYAQSLQGIIILSPDQTKHMWEKEFISKTPLISAYNIIPVKRQLVSYLLFNRKAFYALNFTISKLGEIKDKGMAIEVLTKAIKKTGNGMNRNNRAEALKQLQIKCTLEDLLSDAHVLLKGFFSQHKIHLKLLM